PVPRPALADSAPLCADLRARAGDVDQLPADSARKPQPRPVDRVYRVEHARLYHALHAVRAARDAGDSVGDLRTERPRPADTLGGGAGDRRRAGTAVADAALTTDDRHRAGMGARAHAARPGADAVEYDARLQRHVEVVSRPWRDASLAGAAVWRGDDRAPVVGGAREPLLAAARGLDAGSDVHHLRDDRLVLRRSLL